MKKLIVGLGNPGSQYQWTRHNLGFLVLEALGAKYDTRWRHSCQYQGLMGKVIIGDVDCSLLMPVTFMNNSGVSLRCLFQERAIPLENILVVCDDLSLPFGKLRLRPLGSAGGHNGLKSIFKELNSTNLSRLRMGIDVPQEPRGIVDHVLSNFTSAEKKVLPDFINHALDCVTCWVTEGANAAMNRFN